MDKTLGSQNKNWIIEKFLRFSRKIAIIQKDVEYTYKDLVDKILWAQGSIHKKNIKRGEVVALVSDYSFISIAVFIALLLNRNIIVPIATKKDGEISERLKEPYIDKKILLDGQDISVSKIRDRVARHDLIERLSQEKEAGLILFSSGSTGRPKSMIHNLNSMLEIYKLKKERDSNILIFLMFDHIGGVNTLFNALSSGTTITIPESRDVENVCKLIEKWKVNLLPSSPTFLNLILIGEVYKQFDLTSLNLITYGTEPMPQSLLEKLQTIFPKVKFLQTFGTSETGIARTISKSSKSTYMKIDDSNTEFKIINGELWLRSKTQVLGYLNYETDRLTKDGWFKTGDLVEETEDGYIRIVGRSEEVINVGGQKVLPSEIETILFEMPQIEDVVAYGEKNIITGQNVAVDIVIGSSIDKISIKKEIYKYCADKLDDYKIPARINIVQNINFGERHKKIRGKY